MPPVISAQLMGCEDCPIHNRAVCSMCSGDELHALDRIKSYRSYTAGDTVVWAGREMPFVASVVTGHATLDRLLEDGRRQTVGLLLPSDFIGRPDRATAPYDVTAHGDLLLCCMPCKPFEELLRTSPNLSLRLLEMTMDELDAARDWMTLLGRMTAAEKVASLLLLIARRTASLGNRSLRSGARLRLPLTRDQMADYLGMTLETVSRQVSALKKGGAIQLPDPRTMVIADLDALTAMAGEAQAD